MKHINALFTEGVFLGNMKENTVVTINLPHRDKFINVTCFDCHLEKKPDTIATSTSNGDRAIRNAQEKVNKHGKRGHRINFIIGGR